MRLIIDDLRKKPMPIVEIEKLVSGKPSLNKVKRRAVQSYMAELKALGLVVYNYQEKVYELAEYRRVFQSRHDYDIALEHSRNLGVSTEKKQRFDQIEPFFALDLLVFHDRIGGLKKDTHDETMQDFDSVFQHLISGYPEIRNLMEKYRELSGDKYLLNATSIAGGIQEDTPESERLDLMKKKELELKKERDDLAALLVGKLYFIVKQVKEGTPLLGRCDYCPNKYLTVKDSEKDRS